METQQSLFLSSLQEPETKEKAFKKLVQEYKERLYWHIRKIVLDHEDVVKNVTAGFVSWYILRIQ